MSCKALCFSCCNISHGRLVCSNINRLICLFVCVLSVVGYSFAQEESEKNNSQYTIIETHYNIKGFVTIAAIKNKLDLREDATFNSLQELVTYVLNTRNVLTSLDALAGTMSTVLFTHEWNENEQRFDVDLFIYVTAGNTFFILPYFKYTTDSGLTLAARIRDFNFLGSLETLKINADYNLEYVDGDDGGEDIADQRLSSSFQLSYPIQVGNHGFSLSFVDSFEYKLGDFVRLQDFKPFNKDFKNDFNMSLGYSYPLTSRIGYRASVSQAIASRIEKSFTEKYNYGSTTLGTGFGIRLTRTPLPIVGNVSYGISGSYQQNYPIGISEYNYESAHDPNLTRLESIPGFGHNIGFGSIRSIPSTFFREGFNFSLGNNASYNIRDGVWHVRINAEVRGHLLLWNRVGINMRGYGIQNLYFYPDYHNVTSWGTDFDSRLRGVLSESFGDSYRGVSFNFDAMINMFKVRLTRIFSAEVHMGPLFDVALRQKMTANFDIENDIKYTTGLEVIAHHLYFSGIRLRGSYGFDLGKTIKDNEAGIASIPRGIISNREISIGLSLFY